MGGGYSYANTVVLRELKHSGFLHIIPFTNHKTFLYIILCLGIIDDFERSFSG